MYDQSERWRIDFEVCMGVITLSNAIFDTKTSFFLFSTSFSLLSNPISLLILFTPS